MSTDTTSREKLGITEHMAALREGMTAIQRNSNKLKERLAGSLGGRRTKGCCSGRRIDYEGQMGDDASAGCCGSCLDRIRESPIESSSRSKSEGPLPRSSHIPLPPQEGETREQYRGYHSMHSGDARKVRLTEWERKHASEPESSPTTRKLISASSSTNNLTQSPLSLVSSLPDLLDPSSSNTSLQSALSLVPSNAAHQLVPFYPRHNITYPSSHPLHDVPRHKHSEYFNALSEYTISPRVSRLGPGSDVLFGHMGNPKTEDGAVRTDQRPFTQGMRREIEQEGDNFAIITRATPIGMRKEARPTTHGRSSKLLAVRRPKSKFKTWRRKLRGLMTFSRERSRQDSTKHDRNPGSHGIKESSGHPECRGCRVTPLLPPPPPPPPPHDVLAARQDDDVQDPQDLGSDRPELQLEMRQVVRPLFTSMSTLSLRERQHWQRSLPMRARSVDHHQQQARRDEHQAQPTYPPVEPLHGVPLAAVTVAAAPTNTRVQSHDTDAGTAQTMCVQLQADAAAVALCRDRGPQQPLAPGSSLRDLEREMMFHEPETIAALAARVNLMRG